MNPLTTLKYSRKFWLLVFAVIQTVLFHLVPNFPPEVWQAIDALPFSSPPSLPKMPHSNTITVTAVVPESV